MSTADPADRREVLRQALREIQQLRARLDDSERARVQSERARVQSEYAHTEPVAVIGVGCRFPGNADTPDRFWEIVRDGVDATSEIPADRWDVDAFYHPEPRPDAMYTRRGGFLADVDRFDARCFGINPREARSIDPQHRLLWEVSWEALERAGRSPRGLAGSRTGVFVGITNNEYGQLLGSQVGLAGIDGHAGPGNALNFAPGRLAYMLGLQGPSMAVDSACSSSLVAVHLACQSLRTGDSDLAIAGGVNLILSPASYLILCKTQALSPEGRCKTFDATANGYGRGEGCGVVVLARLSDAMANRDPILAVIRGSAVNQDGPSSGPTVPSGAAQEAVIREALARARVAAADIDYIEAHGTGTPLGDPIELRALAAVLGQERPADRPFRLGSVKTNIGHCESAAGVAGLIKAILALAHRSLPPSLHFREPNPNVPWAELPARVQTELEPWPAVAGRPRLAGVSSFGASGTNAHVVLGEAPPMPASGGDAPERARHVLVLSALKPELVERQAARFEQYLAENPSVSLGDVCYTAATGRAHLAHRLAVIADSVDTARAQLAAVAVGEPSPLVVRGQARARTHGPAHDLDRPRIGFLFTGQGAQYAGMGRGLYDTQPTFRRIIDECAEILQPHLERPLLEVLYPADAAAADAARRAIDRTGHAQPALFALEYALARLWQSWGIEPDIVMGHSVGELVAACVAGVFSLEDGLRLVAARGRLMQALPPGGEMIAVFAAEEVAAEVIAPHADAVSLAAVNGPGATVISGAGPAVRAIAAALRERGIETRPLTVSHAFHSPLMDPVLDDFEAVAAGIACAAPRIALVSNLSGALVDPRDPEVVRPAYWRRHVREPVRFAGGVRVLHEQGVDVFLEIGPQPTLLGMAKRCLPESTGVWLPSLRARQDDWQTLLASLAGLHCRGVAVDWRGFDRDHARRPLVLPTYPFDRQRYWFEPDPAAGAGDVRAVATGARGAAGHPLLGRRVDSPAVTAFDSELDARELDILRDHRVFGHTVVSGVVHLSMALAAASELHAGGELAGVEARDIAFAQPLILPEDQPVRVQMVLAAAADGLTPFALHGRDPGPGSGAWVRCSSGRIRLVDGAEVMDRDAFLDPWDHAAIDAVQARCPEQITGETFYDQHWDPAQHHVGPSFQLARRIWRRDGEALAELHVPRVATRYGAALDRLVVQACIGEAGGHLLKAALPGAGAGMAGDRSYIGFSIEHYRAIRDLPEGTCWCHVRLRPPAGTSVQEAPDAAADASLDAAADTRALLADLRVLDARGTPVVVLRGMRLLPVSPALVRRALESKRPALRARPAALTRDQLRGVPADQRHARLQAYVVGEVAGVLGMPAAEIDPGEPLRDLGFDSLNAVELQDRIAGDLAVTLTAGEWLQGPSPDRLAALIAGRLDGDAPGLAAGTAPAAGTALAAGTAPAAGTAAATTSPGKRALPAADPALIGRWILRPRPVGRPRLRLFCLPFAGGSAQIYHGWDRDLPPWVEVCPVQLPGRAERFTEPAIEAFPALVDALERVVSPLLDVPFALFGASMGGLIGFELAHRLRAAHGREPAHMLIAASAPPSRIGQVMDRAFGAVLTRIDGLDVIPPDDVAALVRLDLVPPELAEEPDMLALVASILCADFRLVQSYRHRPAPPLACPFTVLGSHGDALAGGEDLDAWRAYTRGAFRLHMIDGGHLFVKERRDAVLHILARVLHGPEPEPEREDDQ